MKRLITSVIVFFSIFLIYSGLVGARIINGGILFTDHFSIYGGLGKSSIFAILSFVIMAHHRGYNYKFTPWSAKQISWIVLSLFSYLAAWLSINQLLGGNTGIIPIIFSHVFLIASIILAGIGSFGLDNLKSLLNTYRRELSYSLVLVFVFYGFLTLVYGLWQYFAYAVLHSVKWLLDLSGLVTIVVPPRSLLLSKFGINIAEYCSGIESIALFTGIYALIGFLDWHRFNTRKFLVAFPIALVLLFGFNILRVYFLILAAYYINPTVAFNLFHTYAGMVFFIIYSAIFWKVTYKWMLRKT